MTRQNRYAMTVEDWNKLDNFMDYVYEQGERSLPHAVKAFIFEGEGDLEDRRKRALIIASMANIIGLYAFNALEEISREYENGQTDQMFSAERFAELNSELSELTSENSYEFMTNQSAMRKLYSALTDFMNNEIRRMDEEETTHHE